MRCNHPGCIRVGYGDGRFLGQSGKPESAGSSPPVADDMHHFMEYVFEPNYMRLKAKMAEAPKDKKAWNAIKAIR